MTDQTTEEVGGESVQTETITLHRKGVEKNGTARYAIEGIRGSIRLNKNMFAAGSEPPEEITVTVANLAKPGAAKTGGGKKEMTPEQLDKVRLAAEKAALRAQKATARAEKLQKRAAKYGVNAPVESEAEPAPVAE